MKLLCCVFAALLLLSNLCVFAGVENGPAVVVMDSVSGNPGETVSLQLHLTQNPGITGLRFLVSYDSDKLILESAEYTKLGGGGLIAVNLKNNPFILLWNVALYEFTETGVLCNIKFKIKEDAAAGKVPLKITYGRGDCIDYDLKNLTMDITNGEVNVLYNGSNCDHARTKDVISKEPDCKETGILERVCEQCGTTTATEDIETADHNYGAFVVTKEPSYTEEGERQKTCSGCGDIRTESIPMLEAPEDNETPEGNEKPEGDQPTNPPTGDDTTVLIIISVIAAILILLLVIFKLKRKNKFNKK